MMTPLAEIVGASNAHVDDDETQVKRAGHRFVLTKCLWVRVGSAARKFASNGQTQDPEPVAGHQECPSGALPRTNGRSLSRACVYVRCTQLGNTSTRLRRTAGAAIFNCGATDLLSPDARSSKFRELIGWRVEERTGGTYSTLDVPVLHEGWGGEYDYQTCFLNKMLMRHKDQEEGGNSSNNTIINVQSTDNMEQIHGLDHTEQSPARLPAPGQEGEGQGPRKGVTDLSS
ncbi:hypothetical protein R3P38DRAFT_2758910 [Favolaschia claudopus]|uniref:Uncharacterized protein n=1 Tax=Favolaschia claudopus TaxID=2862362 RepID=A0AAW0E617_9AGAR